MAIKNTWLNFFKPNIYVKNFRDININMLEKYNIKLIICDLDNTLTPHFNHLPSLESIKFVDKIKNNGLYFVLASNNIKKRTKAFAEKLKPHDVMWLAFKPFTFKIKKIIKKYKVKPEEILFIGDQFLLDIFCANLIGAKSILVLPKFDFSDKRTSISSFTEKFIYQKLQHKNMLNSSVYKDETYYEIL